METLKYRCSFGHITTRQVASGKLPQIPARHVACKERMSDGTACGRQAELTGRIAKPRKL